MMKLFCTLILFILLSSNANAIIIGSNSQRTLIPYITLGLSQEYGNVNLNSTAKDTLTSSSFNYNNTLGIRKSTSLFITPTIGMVIRTGNNFFIAPEIYIPISNIQSFETNGEKLRTGTDSSNAYQCTGIVCIGESRKKVENKEKFALVGKVGLDFYWGSLYGMMGASFANISLITEGIYIYDISSASAVPFEVGSKSTTGLKSGLGMIVKFNQLLAFGLEYSVTSYKTLISHDQKYADLGNGMQPIAQPTNYNINIRNSGARAFLMFRF